MGATASFYEALLQASPAAVVAVDKNMIVRTISSSAEELLDIEAGEIIDRHIKDCALLGQVGLADLENILKEGMEHGIACYPGGEGGRKVAVKIRARRLQDPGGKTLGAALILEAPDRNRDTERIINNEKIELIRQMSVGIAHHVRNSLTAVRGFIQLMKEKTGGEPVTGFTEFSSIALKELDRVNDVIGSLLHLADSSESKREAVNVANLLENVFAFIRGKAALAGVLVVKEFSPDLPKPCVDVVQIIHALFNILDNAIKSMPCGGRLTLCSYAIPSESKVCIEITDTGVGIPPENMKNIFNPFFSTREDGVGFGLALANKIIHDHGGDIRVISKEGEGSTFSVYLPFMTLS